MSFLNEDVAPEAVFTRDELTPEHQMLAQTAAAFMRAEVLPHAERLYAHDWAFVRQLLRRAGTLDLLRLEVPEAYGGLGLDKVSAACVAEQIGINPSFGGSIGAHTGIGMMPLVYFGNAEQKRRYLPRLSSGELVAAYALTEPGSGSDALAARTTATLEADGRHYRLNGRKMWITNGGFADLFTVFAKVDGAQFTGFLVERAMGVRSGPDEHKLGLDGSSTSEVILDDVRVPVENVLGRVGEGHKVAFNTLNLGRVKLGARNLACAKAALAGAVDYAGERRQFGRAIAGFGLIQHKLAEMAVKIFVGDAVTFRTLGDVDRALAEVDPADADAVLATIERFAVECSLNKIYSSEALAYVVDEALQVYGGNGYSREYPAERAYRDARITRIYEGTNEINRLIIAGRMMRGRGQPPAGEPGGGPLAAERALLRASKQLACALLDGVAAVHGDRAREAQELLAAIADVTIDVYALESALARAAKLGDPAGHDAARIFATDAGERLAAAGRRVLRSFDGHAAGGSLAAAIAAVAAYPGTDSIAARRRVAALVIEAGHHPF